MNIVSASQLRERMQTDPSLAVLDVRTSVEFRQIHVPGARLVPLGQLSAERLASVGIQKDAPLYLLCRSGHRATFAANRLEDAGYPRCHVVEGGTVAWEKAGFAVEREEGVVSLERQVRIAAGSLVCVGVLLAQFVHPTFLWLSGFVGAGLVFAGVTNTCAMGMLLAKAPWNRVPGDADRHGDAAVQPAR